MSVPAVLTCSLHGFLPISRRSAGAVLLALCEPPLSFPHSSRKKAGSVSCEVLGVPDQDPAQAGEVVVDQRIVALRYAVAGDPSPWHFFVLLCISLFVYSGVIPVPFPLYAFR